MVASEDLPDPLIGWVENWSGRQDLNLRPLGPQPSALPDCATPREAGIIAHALALRKFLQPVIAVAYPIPNYRGRRKARGRAIQPWL